MRKYGSQNFSSLMPLKFAFGKYLGKILVLDFGQKNIYLNKGKIKTVLFNYITSKITHYPNLSPSLN